MPSVTMTFEEQTKDFLDYIGSEKGLAKNTIEAYSRDIHAFCSFLQTIHIAAYTEVTQEHVVQFLSYLKSMDYASSSISRTLIALKVLFRFLKRENHIPLDITHCLDTPKLWQLIPEVLTCQEVERLLEQPDDKTLIGARDKAVLEVLYASGLRVSELCHLCIYSVDDHFVRVLGKGSKERLVPIGSKAIAAIDHYLGKYRTDKETDRHQKLFLTKTGKAMDRVAIWRMIKIYAKQAKIEKNISPHTIRHSFATHLLDNEADLRIIQEMLGHASINSTDRYTHVSKKRLQASFEAFHPRNI
jgi:integrase/recombinase XerD